MANIWRRTGDVAVLCNGCECNIERPLTGTGEEPVGRERICTSEDGICTKTGEKIMNDRKAYDNFKDIFNDPEWPIDPPKEEK